MPVIPAAEAVTHELHGSRFVSYVSPGAGSQELCFWRTEIAAGTPATPHRVNHEEVLLVAQGNPRISLDDAAARRLEPGDVVFVPATSRIALANPGEVVACLWVSTVVGLQATTDDGTTIDPPWAR